MQPALAPRMGSVPQDNVPSEHLLRNPTEPAMPAAYQSATEAMQTTAPQSSTETAQNHDNMAGSEQSDGDQNQIDGRKGYGKRELSTSKRAAQNRAAQRAFRQRKEGYIKKLEEQVRDYQVMTENYKAVQNENYQLRDYIISLQSRLLEAQGEVPPPPSNVSGLQPSKSNHPSQTHTLPRLAEMGAAGLPPDHSPTMHEQRSTPPDITFFDAANKRSSVEGMTPAQAALQGPSILGRQSPSSR